MKLISWKHELKLTKAASGSQKAHFVCKHCYSPFAFYNMTTKEAEEYVNKYYPEVVMMWNQNRPGYLERYWKRLKKYNASIAQ